jgi:16S rRNA (uracil1498-N3)-methyltransferase
VLRLKVGEEVIAVTESRESFRCKIKYLDKSILLKIVEKLRPNLTTIGPLVTVACAIPKKAKFDDIVDKLTQLGVYRIIPLLTERVIVKLDDAAKTAKMLRWRKIAKSAAEQAHRVDIPIIDEPGNLKDLLLSSSGFDLKLIPHLEGERSSLKSIFQGGALKSVLVLIGPEGDFTPKEIKLAKGAGFIPITLGEHVLRVDTAAIAILSFIKIYAHI